MSIELMCAAWKLRIKPTPKLVLLALADNANDQGGCWPSLKYLEAKTSLSRRALENNINILKGMGLIDSIQRFNKNGSLTSNYYTVKVGQDMQGTPQEMRDPPAADAYKPSIKPSINKIYKQNVTLTNYLPSERIKELAKEKGWADPNSVLEEFKDHHVSRGTTLKDVEAALRTWLRNGLKYQQAKRTTKNGYKNTNATNPHSARGKAEGWARFAAEQRTKFGRDSRSTTVESVSDVPKLDKPLLTQF